MNVVLLPDEMEVAAFVGMRRRLGAAARGLSDRYGSVDVDVWGIDVEGAAAEMAVAKALGRYWLPALHVQSGTEGDVASYQVRSTTHDGGCLLIKTGDDPQQYFVLAIGRAPCFRIAGWIKAADGKREEWWRTVRGRSAFFVPQNALRPLRAT